MKLTRDIARAVQHPNDFYSVLNCSVENHIPSNRKALQALEKFITMTSESWLQRQQTKFDVEPVDERIGVRLAILSDVLPYLSNIYPSERP